MADRTTIAIVGWNRCGVAFGATRSHRGPRVNGASRNDCGSWSLETDPFLRLLRIGPSPNDAWPRPQTRGFVTLASRTARSPANLRSSSSTVVFTGVPARHVGTKYRSHASSKQAFAALNIAVGHVISEMMPRHGHQEWIRFSRSIDESTPPDVDLHLIVDKDATH